MTIKAIIFDLDGTLIDSMGLWRMVDEEFLSSRGISVPADLFDHLPQGNSFIQTALYFKERFSLEETGEEIMQIWTDMVADHYAGNVPLKDGVLPLLERISRAGLKLGLATSNSYELAEKSLRQNMVWHMFEYVSTGDMNLMGKPFPDIYLHCARGLEVEPDQCIAIEDTLSGVQAAKAAGMHTLAIYDEDSIRQHTQIRATADAFCEDYAAILKEIQKVKEEI